MNSFLYVFFSLHFNFAGVSAADAASAATGWKPFSSLASCKWFFFFLFFSFFLVSIMIWKWYGSGNCKKMEKREKFIKKCIKKEKWKREFNIKINIFNLDKNNNYETNFNYAIGISDLFVIHYGFNYGQLVIMSGIAHKRNSIKFLLKLQFISYRKKKKTDISPRQ